MPREQDVRRARDEMTKAKVEQDRRSGVAVPDTRKAERWASEIARRNDRRENDKK